MEAAMADETKTAKISCEELMVSTLAMTDALAKLLIAKGIITDEEFKAQLGAVISNYRGVLKCRQGGPVMVPEEDRRQSLV